jgi:hypothetical protein
MILTCLYKTFCLFPHPICVSYVPLKPLRCVLRPSLSSRFIIYSNKEFLKFYPVLAGEMETTKNICRVKVEKILLLYGAEFQVIHRRWSQSKEPSVTRCTRISRTTMHTRNIFKVWFGVFAISLSYCCGIELTRRVSCTQTILTFRGYCTCGPAITLSNGQIS